MPIIKEKYWTKILPKGSLMMQDEGDGKWIAFVPRNFIGVRKTETRTLIYDIEKIVNQYNLLGALVTTRNQDIVVIFTTAERNEIWRVKKILQNELKIKENNLMWKAHFETDIDWKNGEGKLWFIDCLISSQERKEKAIAQKRLSKAKGIQRYNIDPCITRFRRIILEENIRNRKSMVIHPVFPSY
jgi:hypothetical protein